MARVERIAHQRDAAEARALQFGGGHADAVNPQAALGVDVFEQVAVLDLGGVELLEPGLVPVELPREMIGGRVAVGVRARTAAAVVLPRVGGPALFAREDAPVLGVGLGVDLTGCEAAVQDVAGGLHAGARRGVGAVAEPEHCPHRERDQCDQEQAHEDHATVPPAAVVTPIHHGVLLCRCRRDSFSDVLILCRGDVDASWV